MKRVRKSLVIGRSFVLACSAGGLQSDWLCATALPTLPKVTIDQAWDLPQRGRFPIGPTIPDLVAGWVLRRACHAVVQHAATSADAITEDCFYGSLFEQGLGSFTTRTRGGVNVLEVDHIQYGDVATRASLLLLVGWVISGGGGRRWAR